MKQSEKLEQNKLWQLASDVTEQSYQLIDKFPEEEKWGMQSKLQGRAFDLTSDIAEAAGSVDPRDVKWHLGLARRSLFGLKNILHLAHRTGYIESQSELMVKLDKLGDLVDKELTVATGDIPRWFREMNPPKETGK